MIARPLAPSGKKPITKHLPKGLAILHEDNDILVVNKPSGLLTIGTDTEKTKTVYHALTDYVRKGCAKSSKHVFIVHRLDRETSGLLVFAKTREAKERLQEQWGECEKKYLAVVHGTLKAKSGTLSSYLAENKAHGVYATTDTATGKLAKTAYRVVKEIGDKSLLEIELLTGRKHQIRVHLADQGHPVVGDRRYGRKESGSKQLALHAASLAFPHPVSGRRLVFEAAVPGFIHRLVGGVPG